MGGFTLLERLTKKIWQIGEQEEFHFLKRIAGDSIRTIFDVGANQGQSALFLKKLFPGARLYSFEPVLESFKKLQNNLFKYKDCRCYRMALGEENGHREIYLNQSSDSNSLLQNSKNFRKFTDGWNGLEPKSKATVPIQRLDTFLKKIKVQELDFQKIDTQGTDLKVLHGAEKILQKQNVRYIATEIIFVPIYESQANFRQILKFLSDK